MNAEELKAAAEMAGLELRRYGVGNIWQALCHDGKWRYLDSCNPLMVPYVAELLTAKVREHMEGATLYYRGTHGAGLLSGWWWRQTAEQRIRAAMDVLKGGGA